MKHILIYIIKFYQFLISPIFGNKCRYLPSCSEYFIEALQFHGLLKGTFYGVKRILKCHPFKMLGGGHGIDLVPLTENYSKKKELEKNG